MGDVSNDLPFIMHMEFLKTVMVGFPIFPIRIKATKNFHLKASRFTWEVIKDKDTPMNSKSLVHFQFVYVPTEDTLGKFLRITITPSDGKQYGEPYTIVTENPVSPPPETSLVFLDRFSRLDLNNEPNVIRVVTYNILADIFASPIKFSPSSPIESLQKDYRLPLLTKEIFSYDPDIVCLQEVDTDLFKDYYDPFFYMHGGKYEGRFSSKIGKFGSRSGQAIFFNKKKFAYLCAPPKAASVLAAMKILPLWKSKVAKNPDLKKRLEDRDQILQINILRSKINQSFIVIVANIHLFAAADGEHIRCLQTIACAQYLQTVIKSVEIRNPSSTVTLLFCGDFNCTPPYASIRLLTTGAIKDADPDWASAKNESEHLNPGVTYKHNLNLSNSHPEDILTNVTKSFSGCLDYIFYESKKMKLVKNYPPPSKARLASLSLTTEDELSLPNFNAPSDHLALIADFLPLT